MKTKTAPPGDRRIAPRSMSSVRTYLIPPAGSPLRGITKNLSRSGLFLQTPVRAEASLGKSAMVVFAVERGKVVRLLRYSVIVKRESQHGYGLAFGRTLWSTAVFRRQ
jgi:hypothetical protein